MVRATLEGAVRVTHTGPVDVWLLDEGDDEQAKALCAELGVRHFTRHGVPEWNRPKGVHKARTKHGNYNARIAMHGGDYEFYASVDTRRTPLLARGRRRRPDHRAGVEFAGRPQRDRLVGDPLQQGGVVLAALPFSHLDLLGRRARRVDPEGRGVRRVLGPGTGDGGLVDVGGRRTAHREPEHREHRERADQPGHAAPLHEGTSSDDSSVIVDDPSPRRALALRSAAARGRRDPQRRPLVQHLMAVLGVIVTEIALSVLVYDLTGSPLMSALAFAVGFLPYLVGGTLLAGVADRCPARRVLVVCDPVCAGCVAAMAAPGTGIAVLALLRCALAVVSPVFAGTRMATLADILGDGDLFVLGRSLLRTARRGSPQDRRTTAGDRKARRG